MSPLLVMMVMFAGQAMAQLNIDLSRAEIDPNTGNFCVMQKVSFITFGEFMNILNRMFAFSWPIRDNCP